MLNLVQKILLKTFILSFICPAIAAPVVNLYKESKIINSEEFTILETQNLLSFAQLLPPEFENAPKKIKSLIYFEGFPFRTSTFLIQFKENSFDFLDPEISDSYRGSFETYKYILPSVVVYAKSSTGKLKLFFEANLKTNKSILEKKIHYFFLYGVEYRLSKTKVGLKFSDLQIYNKDSFKFYLKHKVRKHIIPSFYIKIKTFEKKGKDNQVTAQFEIKINGKVGENLSSLNLGKKISLSPIIITRELKQN